MLKTLDVVAAIIEKDNKILLAQRPMHADQPGLWEFAGGKVEAGETQPEALIRELQEELGTFLNNQVSLAAMPHIEMVSLTGERMRTALSGFVKCLYDANPDSVGGKIPGDGFYYLPPQGYLDDSNTSVSGEDVPTDGSASGDLQ